MNIRKIVKEEVTKVLELMLRREDEINNLPNQEGEDSNANNFRKQSPMYTKAKSLKTESIVGAFNDLWTKFTKRNMDEKQFSDKLADKLLLLYKTNKNEFTIWYRENYESTHDYVLVYNEMKDELTVCLNKRANIFEIWHNKDYYDYDADINIKRFNKLEKAFNFIVKDIKDRTEKIRQMNAEKEEDDYKKEKSDKMKQISGHLDTIKESKTTDTTMKPNKKTEDDKAIETIRKERAKAEEKPMWPNKVTDENLERVIKKLNVEFNTFTKEQFKKGMKIELKNKEVYFEDLLLAGKKVWEKIRNNPEYYAKKENMEKMVSDKIETKTKAEPPMTIKEHYVRQLVRKEIKKLLEKK